MTTLFRRLGGGLIALIAPVVALIGYVATRGRLPDPLPTHWNLNGAVNNIAPAGEFFAGTFVISAVLALAVLAAIFLARTPIAGRMLAAFAAFGAWIAAGIWVTTATASLDVASAQDVSLPWYTVPALVGVPALAGLAVWAVLPGRWQHPSSPAVQPSGIVLAPGEAVVWVDHASAPWAHWAGIAAVVAAAVVLIFFTPAAAIPLLVVAIALTMTAQIVVRIDGRGVHTSWGPFGWPRSRVPLEQIVSARCEEIRPVQWGGWGYRISSRGVAIVIQGGPGLVLDRGPAKPPYAVTIPHAAAGADVLNALIAREHAGRP